MQKLNYDYYNNIEVPTFVLSNVYHHHIGVINNINIESIQYSFNMNARQEVSFDIYKELNGEKCDLWDKIIDLKYVYIPEHDEYYVLAVSTDDSDNTVKHCSLTSAGEYELSNKIIRSLEINTESDILRNVNDTNDPPNPPYAPNVLCNFDDPDNSILHRALKDKAPDWSIAHCDETIAHIQRTFTVTNQKIYDFLTSTLAKEYDCLFQFDSVNRTISCYDLLNICEDCGERGEFVYECPNCGSKKIRYGYGKNTNIFITYNNFSEKITRDGDEGAVKNCFHVTGGDDYMNDTIKNINPNGSVYIYNFSQQDYDDMPPKLRQGLEEYQKKYDELYEPYQEIAAKWYDAKNNYYFYKTSMMPRGDNTLWEANHGYKLGDEIYVKTLASWAYLKCVKVVGDSTSGDEEFDATGVINGQLIQDNNVTWEVCKNIITPSSAEQSYNDIVTYFQSNQIYFLTSIPTALTQVNNEVINMSQLQINNLYKVTIISDGKNKVEGTKWYGRLRVTNSGNEKDTYTSEEILEINLHVVNNGLEYASYMEDKVVKRINRTDKTFINLYEIPLDENDRFKALLTQYGLDSLSSFSKSYQNCIDVLIANGIKDENSTYMHWNTYNGIYLPTYNRKTWVDEELAKREATVNKWYELDKEYSLQMSDIHDQLKLENFLLDPEYIDPRTHEKDPYVWIKAFYNYVREDTYTNSNYISTGLSDGEVINNAKQLFKIAEKELKKACELQVTLNDTIKNLLNTDEFKNYKDKYNLGDFIFVECDGDDWEDDAEKNRGLYRLRLISASYSFGSPGDINFTFSNVTKVQNFFSDAQSVINSAQTISGSYNAVVHQVKNNSDTTDLVNTWTNEGLESAKSIIANNNNEEVTMGEYGIYAKEYDDIKDEYSPEQLRITHNNITFTDDNWETAALAIGKNTFRYYNTDVSQGAIGWTTKTDYGVNAKFLEAGYVIGGQIIGSEVVSKNYQVADPSQGIQADGSYINLDDGSFTLAGGGLVGYRNQDGTYYLNYKGDVTGVLDVDVGSTLGVWTVGADGFYSGTSVLKPSDIAVTGNIRAADFYVGTSTTTTLSSILNGKQDTLIPGTNITIDPTTNTISASSGTEVEPNPVEPATDTLNSIKIDDTVYEIVGGDSVNLYYDTVDPHYTLGEDKDIYAQIGLKDYLLSVEYSGGTQGRTYTYSLDVYNKYNINVNGYPFYTNEYFSFSILPNLQAGKTYKLKCTVQMSDEGSPTWNNAPRSGGVNWYGVAIQDRPYYYSTPDMAIDGNTLEVHGSAPCYFQSFHQDYDSHNYEYTFTIRENEDYFFWYICLYFTSVNGYCNVDITNLEITTVDDYGDIQDLYVKVGSTWRKYNDDKGGTSVEANPVETATDTLNSIKIDDTVYEIVGGTGGVEMHQGIDVPDSSLGNNDDIYLQMKSTIGNLLSFDASHSGAAITNYSATVTDNKWDITATFVDNWEYHSFAVYSLQNLTVGKKYTISFDFQNDGTPPLYGIGELFGLTLQHSNRVIDMRNWSSDLVENGEFKYFENSYYGEWWYQSFPNDTKRVHYEFEFTARQGTEYIGFYGDRTSGNLTCSLYELCVGDKVQTNKIKDVYYKLNNQWSLYDRNVTLYHGLQSPSYDLGNDADIYIQLAPDSNSLQTLHDTGGMNGELNYTFTNNNRVYEYKAEYNHSQWHDGRTFLFFPDDLEEGKTYLVHFDAQSVDGSWSGSGDRNQSRFYGLAYQKQNNIVIHDGTQYEHVANGGYEYLSQFDDGIYYQSFFYDHEKHTYEFEFVATQQGYLCFYADDFVPYEHHHIEITNFYVVGMDTEGSEINKTYYKLNDEWIENESGKTYEAGDNIQISDDNVISATDTTYDNFEGTDGTEDGASGLVPPPLTTDVNKFLKSDGTWAEVSSGGGDVADVFVNGVSVLDENDIAQVFSHQEITEQEYEALPSTKESDNIMYCIKGSRPSTNGNYFTPIIYSTEEREVGVWIDNKPLYKKSYILQSLIVINNNGTNINSYIDNVATIEQITNAEACNSLVNLQTSNIFVGKSNNNLTAYCAEAGGFNIITLWYTKTTDVAGSAHYTTLGVPAVHYDGNEKIVGTYYGETLYEKSEHIILSTPISPNTDTTVNFSDFSNITSFLSLEAVGGLYGNSDHVTTTYGFWEQSTSGSSSGDRIIKEWDMSHMVVRTGSNYNNFPSAGVDNRIREFWVTMRYTKD